jgi:hypothetical protein
MRDEEFFIHRYVKDQTILLIIILLKLTYASSMKEVDMSRLVNTARIIISKMRKGRVSVRTGQYSRTGDSSVSIQAGRDAYMSANEVSVGMVDNQFVVTFGDGRVVKVNAETPFKHEYVDRYGNHSVVEIRDM